MSASGLHGSSESAPVADGRVVALALDGTARVQIVRLAQVCAEVTRRHHLRGRAEQLAAELVVANALLAAWVKGEERVQLQLQSERPEVSFFGEVDGSGHCRARLAPSHVGDPGPTVDGVILAIKADGTREMYRGVTAVRDETIEAALRRHLEQSDQVTATVRIVVDLATGRAGGLMVERLPILGDDEEDVQAAFEEAAVRLAACPPDALLDELDAGILLGERLAVLERHPLAFSCACSRERVERMLVSLGPVELADMVARDGGATVTCHFCTEVYAFDADALGRLASEGAAEA